MEAWIRPDAPGTVVGMVNATDTSYVPVLYVGTDSLLRGSIWGFPQLTSPGGVVGNGWHHVALTFSATTLTLYVDGVAVASAGGAANHLDMFRTYVGERIIGLPGGATLTKTSTGDTWALPNIHGDTVALTNGTGVKQGATRTYDPFGQTTGGGIPDTLTGNFDYGWLGQHQRPVETQAGLQTIEMGARRYLPGLGRFLQVDPVEGGCSNDYVYVHGDPVNVEDLDGRDVCSRIFVALTALAGALQSLGYLLGNRSLERLGHMVFLVAVLVYLLCRWGMRAPKRARHRSTFRKRRTRSQYDIKPAQSTRKRWVWRNNRWVWAYN